MRRLLALAAFALLTFVGGASADPIGGPNSTCGTCQGSSYALFYSGVAQPDSDPLTQTFDIFLAIQTATYTGGPLTSTWLDDVAIKVSPETQDASLIAAPPAVGSAAWVEVDGGISNDGCDGHGGGFVCADYNSVAPFDPVTNPPGVALGGLLIWEFQVTVLNGDLLGTLPVGSTVKARYVDTEDGKVGALVSENLTLQTGGCPPSVCSPFIVVPEPLPITLIGAGLLAGLAFQRRRK